MGRVQKLLKQGGNTKRQRKNKRSDNMCDVIVFRDNRGNTSSYREEHRKAINTEEKIQN